MNSEILGTDLPMTWALSITVITVRTNHHGTMGGVVHRTSCQLHIEASHTLTEVTSLAMTLKGRPNNVQLYNNFCLAEVQWDLVGRPTLSGKPHFAES